jgi:hypothetical protein
MLQNQNVWGDFEEVPASQSASGGSVGAILKK